MQGDDPPFLPVGTDVSAKYKGAFCEAKVKKVVRNIKCKLTLKTGGGTITVNDDVIKGTLRVGSTVEVKQDLKKDAMEAIITKIQDCSQYTVVFDDGDITTLRRSALCLKSGRHFNESETLDQLPLTHPEHFSTPVIAGRRGRRGRAQSEESEGEGTSRRIKADSAEQEPHVGRVVLVEAAGGTERRRPHQPAFPALVVAPTVQIKVKEDYLVRSFKDGRYYTVPKKEAREFRKGSAPMDWAGVEAAMQYLNNGVLPPHWDRDALFNEPRNTSDDSSDDEPREEKDHFVAQLYKFMDDRGTPLNRNPTIANRDIDLYRLFRVVQKLGGYNRVTNQNQWKTIADKMGFHPVTTSITNLCKQAYKKFLHSFEDFYRKLGVTLVAHPRGARTPPAGRSLIRDRDKQLLTTGSSTSASSSSTPTNTPVQRTKDSDKSETDKSDKSEKEDKVEKTEKQKDKMRTSDGEDSADNQPLAVVTPKIDKEKEKNITAAPTAEEKSQLKPRSQSKSRSAPPIKIEPQEKRTLKRRPLSSKSESINTNSPRASRRPHVSTDSDSSGRASRCGLAKKMQSRRSQSANSASSGNTIASNSNKRPRKRKTTEPSTTGDANRAVGTNVKAQVGDKLKVYYGPTQSESKVTYEAKVIEISSEGMLRVHYTGWNTRYDEWIKPQRIALNVTQHEARNKKNVNTSRRSRSKRTEESSARSDSDSESDSDENVKNTTNKTDNKLTAKTPSRSKEANPSDNKSSVRPRKRPVRLTSTPSSTSPIKKTRTNVTSHQGRDYDLNEIRSELKGLHTVKQEPEDMTKQDLKESEMPSTSLHILAPAPEPPPPEKQAEDVYEFKEPEPFEFELHDEKKKRTHRIFDDISPSKYTSTLSKSLSEEISEDPLRPKPSSLRSPNLSPFRDFGLTRDVPGKQSPEDDSKDGLFSLDDDSFPGDGSSGPIFEGFTPAKNQETYSKKSKVSKLRELIDDSPDSPADDEQSSDDEMELVTKKVEEDNDPEHDTPFVEESKSPEEEIETSPKDSDSPVKETEDVEDIEKSKESEEIEVPSNEETEKEIPTIHIDPPKTPVQDIKVEFTDLNTTTVSDLSECLNTQPEEEVKEEPQSDELSNVLIALPNPVLERNSEPVKPEEKIEIEPAPKFDSPLSPVIDTEEDKSEPDSPARMDLPEPPPGFRQSDGPKIAEKLLKAINSAKRLSTSPPPSDSRPNSPLKDVLKVPEIKLLVTDEPSKPELVKIEPLKPVTKPDVVNKMLLPEMVDSIFGEASNINDSKRDNLDFKKLKPDEPIPIRLQSPLNILERRKSVADVPLITPGKNNKVLSDTIQKLSSQINQSAVNISLPSFPSGDRSESTDSDDSDRRLIIDKLSFEEWGSGGSSETSRGMGLSAVMSSGLGPKGLHAGKSPGEWSAGETLLMLEDACKNERKHSASVVVAGSGRSGLGLVIGNTSSVVVGEEDSNISLLLCEETIPGSPAPDSEPAPSRQRLHMPFASAAAHHNTHSKDEGRDDEELHESNMKTVGASNDVSLGGGAASNSGEGGVVAAGGVGAANGTGGGGAGGGVSSWARRQALIDNTPPTTPDSSLDMSPPREQPLSERGSPSERKDDEEDSRLNDSSMLDIDKPHGIRSRKASESSAAGGGRGRTRRRRDTDEHAPHHAHAHSLHHAGHVHPPLKYNFYVDLDPSWDSQTRINVLTTRLADLRKAYHSVKAELAAIDRRRKKLRRKEREAVKAAKAACS